MQDISLLPEELVRDILDEKLDLYRIAYMCNDDRVSGEHEEILSSLYCDLAEYHDLDEDDDCEELLELLYEHIEQHYVF